MPPVGIACTLHHSVVAQCAEDGRSATTTRTTKRHVLAASGNRAAVDHGGTGGPGVPLALHPRLSTDNRAAVGSPVRLLATHLRQSHSRRTQPSHTHSVIST
jgi:hypothetical protein